ncbi:MAG TPA: PPOX class F420-dependent oxidoreductase [Acidimicrobiales bacterium]|jgi:PPOX class probable F420-dependent enzyme|nr:PPOX class F420-dependent oxidoreductase [Acidimicrobiales bacterium]
MAPTSARDTIVERDQLMEFIRPRHHAVLSTTRQDGRPQLSPVTMGVDPEDRIVVSTYPERAKARNATRDERISVCVLSDEFGGEWVQVDGRGQVITQPEAVEALVVYFRSISGEHPDWAEYREAMRKQGKVLLRVTIDRWGPISRGGFPPRLLTED